MSGTLFAGGAYIDVYVCDRFVTMRHGDAYIQGDVCATREKTETANPWIACASSTPRTSGGSADVCAFCVRLRLFDISH